MDVGNPSLTGLRVARHPLVIVGKRQLPTRLASRY